MNYYVYILTNSTGVAMYIGVTRDLVRRVYEHKHHLDPGSFTSKYDICKLVYYEATTDVYSALEREKQLKHWRRSKKNWLVGTMNPNWDDLYPSIIE
jgi:putative endonuclease